MTVSDKLPSMVKNNLDKLSKDKQNEFWEEYRRKRKSSTICYLLWIIGWHYAYVGKWGVQVLFWVSIYGFLIWWLIDIVRVVSLVREYNADLSKEILKDLKTISEDIK